MAHNHWFVGFSLQEVTCSTYAWCQWDGNHTGRRIDLHLRRKLLLEQNLRIVLGNVEKALDPVEEAEAIAQAP